MNWDDLRVFLAVARNQKLSAAALSVGLDATTVSRRVERLQHALNATLFEQSPAGHVLTHRGRQLLAHVEEIERAALAARGDLTGEPGQLEGSIRVSLSEGFGTWLVARHLGEFHERHPKLMIDLVATSGFLNPSKREADIAIMLARPARGPLIARKLTDYALRLYAAKDYVRRHEPIRAPADLAAHPLIGYVPDFIYAPELRYLDEVSPGLEPTIRSSSINAQHRLIAAGLGLGVLPCFIGDQDPGLDCLLCEEVTITRTFWLVVHRDMRKLARVATFMDWITALAEASQPLLLGQQSRIRIGP